jgi:hypothetical protein
VWVCEGVGRATSVPWPGAHSSSCRATTQAEPGRGAAAAVLCSVLCVVRAYQVEGKKKSPAESAQQLQGHDPSGTGPRSGSAVLCGPIR